MRKFSFALLGLCLIAVGASASTTIDMSSAAVNNTTGWTSVAQTFTAPGNELTSWTFWLGGQVSDITFQVYAGDAQNGLGSPLYSQDLFNYGPGKYTLSLAVPLTTGDLYSVFYNLNGSGSPSILWGTNTYSGGWGEWGYGTSVSDQWNKTLSTGFIAVFNGTATPEPGTLVLLGTGALGLAASIRRKLMN